MGRKHNDDLDSLLNPNFGQQDYDGEEQEEEESSPEKGRENLNEIKSKLEEFEKKAKDLEEVIRQQAEENKELKKFREKIMYLNKDPNEDSSEIERQKLEDEYLRDPISVIQQLTEQKFNEIENNLTKRQVNNQVDASLKWLRKNYEIDFDKDYPKIVEQLNKFNDSTKQSNPKKALLDACRLAGVIKGRKGSKDTVTDFTAGGYSPGESSRRGVRDRRTEEQIIKERILKGSRKNNNIFGI